MIPVPTSNHNEALTGDVLYSAFLNYEWRQIVIPFIVRGMEEIAAGIEDESERQAFEVLYGALIDDFYNEDSMDGTPVGSIVWYIGLANTVSPKWLRCIGQTLNVADYPDLALILDSPFYSGGPTFTLPDLRNRFLYGSESNIQIGMTGGAVDHTLTIAEMPAHTHALDRVDGTGNSTRFPRSSAANIGSGATQSTGGGAAHNNMPPYMRGFWCIKALP